MAYYSTIDIFVLLDVLGMYRGSSVKNVKSISIAIKKCHSIAYRVRCAYRIGPRLASANSIDVSSGRAQHGGATQGEEECAAVVAQQVLSLYPSKHYTFLYMVMTISCKYVRACKYKPTDQTPVLVSLSHSMKCRAWPRSCSLRCRILRHCSDQYEKYGLFEDSFWQ